VQPIQMPLSGLTVFMFFTARSRLFLRFLWWPAAIAAIFATLIYIYRGSKYIEEQEQQKAVSSF